MKKYAYLLAAAVFAAFASPAAAQGWSAGVGYTQYDAEGADVGGITGRLGYDFTPNWGVEGEASFGVGDDDGAELDNAFGLYGIGKLPLSEQVSLHARVGYQTVEGNGGDDDGVGYGVGAQWNVNERFGVRGDYTRLTGEEDDVDTFGVSAVVKF